MHPQFLVRHFRGTAVTQTKAGRRKLRLFACGCCRQIWANLGDSRLRGVVNAAERFADGQATAHEMRAANLAAAKVIQGPRGFSEEDETAQANTGFQLACHTADVRPFSAAFGMTAYPLPLAGYCGDEKAGNAIICTILRDIFGNPFRPVAFSPSWRTDTAIALAKQMYDSRDFSAMPILADALQDAGCDNDDILAHCRNRQQIHVRGCWVVDLVLAKS